MTQFEALTAAIADVLASGVISPESTEVELAAALIERGVRVVDDDLLARALIATDPFQFCEHTPRGILEALDAAGH